MYLFTLTYMPNDAHGVKTRTVYIEAETGEAAEAYAIEKYSSDPEFVSIEPYQEPGEDRVALIDDDTITDNKCEACKGTGTRHKNVPGNEGEPEYDIEGECNHCGGTGIDDDDPFAIQENAIHCKGRNCDHNTTNDPTVSERHDAYGLSTGYYCDHCYDHNYPYRKDKYYDESFAGERMDDDY